MHQLLATIEVGARARFEKIEGLLGRPLRDHRHAIAVYLAFLTHEQRVI